ncbi:MAG: two-component sensor histidine kinase [Actinobacteria bacterium]|jgi:two-component system sensor histidine kinase SenX3|uniref:histidine kinase n=1 Tax=freshwater metagenome TaxID=449393 RepID=A0A6J6CC57_9ZZZZ|nr:two-component sensor histidine kinase [Actinomycetota bacterium]
MVNIVNTIGLEAIILSGVAALAVGASLGWFLGKRTSQVIEVEPDSFPDLVAEVLELMGSVGMVIDGSNKVVGTNSWAESFGLVSRGLLVHPETVDLVKRARSGSDIESFEGVLRVGLAQEKVSVAAKAKLVEGDYVVLILEDRTSDIRLDKTRRDFIENISHELKTPIGAIALLSEAIQEAGDDRAAVSKFAASLNKESSRLTFLVQDIIKLSRLQSEEVLASAEIVDLNDVMAEAIDRNEQLASSRKIRLVSEQGVKLEVFGNKEMLITAVKNLVENAISYSDPGTSVGIGCSAKESIAEITVTDSGAGISPENQQRIFERFYRADPSRSRDTGGTGLGLSIVKHVAKIHRGEIKLFSQVGVGSTFTLRVPLATASDPATGTIDLVTEGK